MRVLVTGSRDFTDAKRVKEVLDSIEGITLLIEGGAKGLDELARLWAHSKGIPVITMFAAWTYYDKPAGPIRNGWLIKYGQPTMAVVFPGNKGTQNMLNQIKKAGIEHMIVV